MPTAQKANESPKKATNGEESPRRAASVHLEGFADAIPSPMAVDPKGSPTATPATDSVSLSKRTDESPSNKILQARNASNDMIQSALLSSLEASYTALQSERDALQTQMSSTLATVDALKLENAALKSAAEDHAKSIEARGKQWRGEVEIERNKKMEMEKKLKCSEERVDRLEVEGETLRGEISRLTKTNEQHTNLITQIQTQNSFSTSQVIPIKLENTRLQQELDAITCHSNHLEEQLSSLSQSLAQARNTHSNEVQFLKSQSDERQWELEKRDREVSSTRRHFELAQAELERMRNVMHEKECQFIEQREMMERDLNKERELVLLKEQVMVLAKDQRDTALEELKSIKVMAAEAAEREGRLESEMESRLKVEVENAVRLIKQEEEGKRVVIADRLRAAEEEKMRLEEDVLNTSTPLKRRRLIAGATVPLAITEGSEDGPLSLTDLYTRLAETEDDLRAEQHENKKLKIIIDRIHRDVASKTPIFQQKQLELENALEELDENRERLDHARREVVDLRADNHDFELKNQEMENECRELKRENHDLALQVQRLLQRGMGQGTGDDSVTFDSIQTLQEQNQKLLRDHRSMSDKIQTLESHINNNHEKLELDQMKEEIVNLRDEREKQLKLVAGIVHQRDLYRALVAKNDAALVQSEGGNQLALVDARAEQLPLLEVKNRELVEEAAKLRADVSTFKYEKEALESRLARIDAHAEELTSSNERMRGEITAANATMARMEADLNQSRGRCERMQISLDAMKDEKESETSKRNRMEELNSKLQMHLDGARSTLAKQQQQFESATSKVKMLEVQLESTKASESRITAEANELRAEIAKQGALLGSVQRIEASLTAKSEGERGHLENEVQRLSEKMSSDEAKYQKDVKKLEGKISDLELSVTNLTEQKQAATENAAKASNEVSQSKLKIQEITLKLNTAEKELSAAKRKLGDATIDTSAETALEVKVESLSSELESTKTELEKANEKVANYRSIAKSSEEQLTEITAASTKYKNETDAKLKRLQELEQSQKDAVAELTKDLMEHRGEKEKSLNELKSKIESLTAQLTSAKKDASEAIARMETLNSEMKSYQLDANNATTNYERELALHAEARNALRDARSKYQAEQSLRETAEATLKSRKTEFEAKESAWDAEKIKLEQLGSQSKARYDDLQKQNHILYEQMTSLSANVEQFQADRTSQLVDGKENTGSVDIDKQISELRELLQFKQSECVMLLADLASSKRTAERERTAAEMAKKSLEEARSELKAFSDSSKAGDSAAAKKDNSILINELKTANDQLVLVRESNTMLREETQRLTKKISDIESECKELKTAASPNNERLSSLEVEKAALEAEKSSLMREVDAWKNRVHSLVSKFNQIDPEEHAQALASIEKLKAETATLNSSRDKAEQDSANAKNLVSKLNKEVSTQKSSIEAFKKALEKEKQDKEKLVKSAQSNVAANKKIVEAQAAAKKCEEALKAKTTEFESEKNRVESLKTILTKMKSQIKISKDAEVKANSNVASLQKQVDELNRKLSETPQAITSPKEASAPEIAPNEKKDSGNQPVETMQDPKKTTVTVDNLDTTANAAETQSDPKPPTGNVPETTVLVKKKGKKRKGTPQKNTSVASSTAPPAKKVAVTTEPVSSQKENIPATSGDSEVKVTSEAPADEAVPVVPEIKMSEAKQAQMSAINEPSAVAAESKSVVPEKKVASVKKMIKLTKKSTEEVQKESPSTSSKAGKTEEEMKMKMLLLKKRKAEMQLKMQAAAKKKAEAEPVVATGNISGKSVEESDISSTPTAVAEDSSSETSPKLSSTKPPASTLPKPLPSVPEKEEVAVEQTDKTKPSEHIEKAETVTPKAAPAPTPLTFGSSGTVAGLNVPASMPLQSEPSCPKPSFFGAPTSASETPAFGSQTASVFGFGTKKAEEKSATLDAASKQPAGASGAFLNLTPPGKTSNPSQFVFGKSANITLPVPAQSPFGVFNKKTQTTPFGSAFGVNPPFGGVASVTAPAEKSADAEKEGTDKADENVEDREVEKEDDSAENEQIAKKA